MLAPKIRSRMRLLRPLFVALLVAGCGDGPTEPKPPVSVAISPVGPLDLYVGDTVTVAASVQHASGTAVDFSSSNAAVATVSQTGLVTAVATGAATITATAIADPSRSASVQLEVLPGASLLIEQLLNSSGTQTLDPSHVEGLVFVQLAVERANATRLEVLIDSVMVECQSFSSPTLSATPTSIQCGFNTAAFDSLTGTPRLRNGAATVSARLVGPDDRVLHTVVGQQVVLANRNALVTRITAPTQAVDGSGLRWIDGDVTVTALPILFDPSMGLARVEFAYTSPAKETTLVADTTAPFSATFEEAEALDGVTDPAFVIAVRSATTAGMSGPQVNTSAIRYDNEPPHPGILIPRPWFGQYVPFSITYDATDESDTGVGRSVASFYAGDPVLDTEELIEQGRRVAVGGDLPRALYDSYRLAANLCDALGNCTPIPGFTFGVDINPPVLELVSFPDSAVNPGTDLTIGIQDDLSGIGRFGMVVSSTMLDARSPIPVCGPIVEGLNLPGHMLKQVCVPDSLGFTAPVPERTAGYYSYTVIPLDQAGNQAPTIVRRVLVDLEKPVIGGVSIPTQLVPGEDISTQIAATDNLDLVRVGARLVFPDERRVGSFVLPFAADSVVDAPFNSSLTTSASVTRRFPFIRTLTYVGNGTAAARRTVVVDSFQFRAVDAAGLASVSSRRVSRVAFGNDTSTLDPFSTISADSTTPDGSFVCTANCRANDAKDLNLTLRIVDESVTGGLPFARVYFFIRSADGEVTLLGPPTSTSSTVQTSTQRTITYAFPYTPSRGLAGTFSVFAVGVTSRGNAMVSDYQAGPKNSVQFFTRMP